MYILYGDLLGLDTSICANEKFHYYQMATLLGAMFNGIDVKPYADPKYSGAQMDAIYNGLEAGLDASVCVFSNCWRFFYIFFCIGCWNRIKYEEKRDGFLHLSFFIVV